MTMELEHIQKIWNTQNQAPMYVIDTDALQARMRRKSRHTLLQASVNEIGLTLIVWFAGTYLVFWGSGSVFSKVTAGAAFVLGGLILWNRFRRKKALEKYDRSLLGEVEAAIETQRVLIRRGQTFFLWFIVPLMAPGILNMVERGAGLWTWVIALGSIPLSWLVVRWGLKKGHAPQLRELERMRQLMLDEAQPENP